MTELTLGQRIAAKRNELGLSQSALGEQLGVSRQSVFKWESDAAIPEIDKLIALSRLFGVSLDWLLGIGDIPRAEAPTAAEPKQDFTAREREILETLSHQKPSVPRWQKWLTVGTAVCAALALVISCTAFWNGHKNRNALEQAKKEAEAYTAQLHAQLQSQLMSQTDLVRDYGWECTPSLNMDSATVRLRITPFIHEANFKAALLIMRDEEIAVLNDCTWSGVAWETEIELRPDNGYRILFRLTDTAGQEWTQELNIPTVSQLGYNLAWPTDYSVTWAQVDARNESLTFTDLHVQIPMPGVFRETEGLWEQCELVLATESGTVLDRFDLRNRSAYSAEINFSGSDLDFTTQTVELSFPEQPIGTKLHLFLNGTLSTGHTISYPVEQWKVQSNGLTDMFHEARE